MIESSPPMCSMGNRINGAFQKDYLSRESLVVY
jgi:hypothetical protein